jgi:hypothetical protein
MSDLREKTFTAGAENSQEEENDKKKFNPLKQK